MRAWRAKLGCEPDDVGSFPTVRPILKRRDRIMRLRLAVLLVLSILTFTTAVAQDGKPAPVKPPIVVHGDEERALGDGFLMRRHKFENGTIGIKVRVPDKYVGEDATLGSYLEGVKVGLLKFFTCDELVCVYDKPFIYVSPPGERQFMAVMYKGDVLVLQFVAAPDEGKGIVGFMFFMPPEDKGRISQLRDDASTNRRGK